MARGWESKSVEDQQAAASEKPDKGKVHLTAQQKVLQSRQEGLRLSRSHLLQQIGAAASPRYRESLERALADVEKQIRSLD